MWNSHSQTTFRLINRVFFLSTHAGSKASRGKLPAGLRTGLCTGLCSGLCSDGRLLHWRHLWLWCLSHYQELQQCATWPGASVTQVVQVCKKMSDSVGQAFHDSTYHMARAKDQVLCLLCHWCHGLWTPIVITLAQTPWLGSSQSMKCWLSSNSTHRVLLHSSNRRYGFPKTRTSMSTIISNGDKNKQKSCFTKLKTKVAGPHYFGWLSPYKMNDNASCTTFYIRHYSWKPVAGHESGIRSGYILTEWYNLRPI